MDSKKTEKKTVTKKAAVKKATTKKVAAVKKTAVKKVAVKKVATVKKATTKKVATKKVATEKVAAKKTSNKTVEVKDLDPTLEIVKKCFKALDDKKADNLKVLDVRQKSPITNYFVIATATSEPHMRALANELEKTLKDMGVKAIGREYNTGSGWVVVDAFDFMAHIFLPQQRGMYGIEALWKDADIIMQS